MTATDRPPDLARLRAILDTITWTTAKTTPRDPHQYAVRGQGITAADFDFVSAVIETFGYVESFQASWMDSPGRWQYVRAGGHRFWIGPPGLINRAVDQRGDYPPVRSSQ